MAIDNNKICHIVLALQNLFLPSCHPSSWKWPDDRPHWPTRRIFKAKRTYIELCLKSNCVITWQHCWVSSITSGQASRCRCHIFLT